MAKVDSAAIGGPPTDLHSQDMANTSPPYPLDTSPSNTSPPNIPPLNTSTLNTPTLNTPTLNTSSPEEVLRCCSKCARHQPISEFWNAKGTAILANCFRCRQSRRPYIRRRDEAKPPSQSIDPVPGTTHMLAQPQTPIVFDTGVHHTVPGDFTYRNGQTTLAPNLSSRSLASGILLPPADSPARPSISSVNAQRRRARFETSTGRLLDITESVDLSSAEDPSR